jgi:hypothetical protein
MQGLQNSSDSLAKTKLEVFNEYIRFYKFYSLSLETLFMACMVFNRFLSNLQAEFSLLSAEKQAKYSSPKYLKLSSLVLIALCSKFQERVALKPSELATDMNLNFCAQNVTSEEFRFIEFEVLQILQFRLAADKNPVESLKRTINRLSQLRISESQKTMITEISSVFLLFLLLNWQVLGILFTIEESCAASIYMGVKYYERTLANG